MPVEPRQRADREDQVEQEQRRQAEPADQRGFPRDAVEWATKVALTKPPSASSTAPAE
ncbi:MAG: hypothetical protein R2909_08180 [Gemmatimonadales bacterium]